jgi:hypothetical protein
MKTQTEPKNRHERRAEAACARQKKPPTPVDLSGPFWNSDQLAAVCHTSRRSIERWRRTGSGPPYLKVGGRRLYDREATLAWLRSRQVTSTSAA